MLVSTLVVIVTFNFAFGNNPEAVEPAAAGYLFAAFALVWILFFVYLLVLFNRQRQLRQEIEALKEG